MVEKKLITTVLGTLFRSLNHQLTTNNWCKSATKWAADHQPCESKRKEGKSTKGQTPYRGGGRGVSGEGSHRLRPVRVRLEKKLHTKSAITRSEVAMKGERSSPVETNSEVDARTELLQHKLHRWGMVASGCYLDFCGRLGGRVSSVGRYRGEGEGVLGISDGGQACNFRKFSVLLISLGGKKHSK